MEICHFHPLPIFFQLWTPSRPPKKLSCKQSVSRRGPGRSRLGPWLEGMLRLSVVRSKTSAQEAEVWLSSWLGNKPRTQGKSIEVAPNVIFWCGLKFWLKIHGLAAVYVAFQGMNMDEPDCDLDQSHQDAHNSHNATQQSHSTALSGPADHGPIPAHTLAHASPKSGRG